jgi:hypothetical protein
MGELTETKYGFRWGPMRVYRYISDARFGYVIKVYTDHKAVEIRVSPKGRMLVVEDSTVYSWEKEE